MAPGVHAAVLAASVIHKDSVLLKGKYLVGGDVRGDGGDGGEGGHCGRWWAVVWAGSGG